MAEKEYIARNKIFEFPIRANHCDKENANKHFISGVESVMEYVENLPSADVAPVVPGRWLGWGKGGTPTYENYGTCSVCCEDAEIYTKHRNYCPNCGAKMNGERKDGEV